MEFPCSLNWTRVHELPDEKETAAAGLVELVGLDRLGDGARIESGSLVGDVDANRVGQQLGAHVHPLVERSRLPRRMALASASERTT